MIIVLLSSVYVCIVIPQLIICVKSILIMLSSSLLTNEVFIEEWNGMNMKTDVSYRPVGRLTASMV
jgi:hypothetical protein